MEHSRLLERKYSFLREISDLLMATDNIKSAASLMLDLAVNYTGARKASVMLASDCGDLQIIASRGIDIEISDSYRARLGEGIAGIIAKDGIPVLIEDVRMDAALNGKRAGVYNSHSFISCPILRPKRLLGLLNVSDKHNDAPFTADEFDLLRIIANQAAASFENALLTNHLKAKTADLEEISGKLAASYALKTDFLRHLSHELRSPLNSINGTIYYLRNYEHTTKGLPGDYFDIIADESAKLTSSVEYLLDYLSLEDENSRIKKSAVDMPTLVKEAVHSASLKGHLRRKNIGLTIDVLKSPCSIAGDKIKIAQFFDGLLSGLSHYLDLNDSIRITVNEDDFVKVNIVLSRGLPEMLIANLFNWRCMFETDKSAATVNLYLAWKIAKTHGWNITTENSQHAFSLTITMPQSTKQRIEAATNTAIGKIIGFITELLDANTCSIMMIDERTGDLVIRNATGLDDETIKATRMKVGERIAGWVALEGRPLLVEDIRTARRFRQVNIRQYSTRSLLSVPLKINEKIIGVINLTDKRTAGPFTTRDLSVLCTLSDRVSHFTERLYSGSYGEHEIKELVASFDSLLASVKRYRKKNSVFPDLTVRILDVLEAAEDIKGLALYASMIYDLGLTCVDESLLTKKELSPPEKSMLRVHPLTSVDLIDSFEFSENVKKAILHHHEKYDGTGYPGRLKEKEIPFISRVLSVVDAFCSMITDRPYRKALAEDTALEEIRKEAGSRFDPRVVKALDKALQCV